MTATHHGHTKVAHLDEHRLLKSLKAGELAAAAELVHRVASDAWLVALAVQQRAELATDLSVRAVVRTLADAVDGRLEGASTFRAAAMRRVRDQSLTRRMAMSDGQDLDGDDALACFAQLDEPSRSALLLADIVLLPDDQLGFPLDLPDDVARRLADRAGHALRQRLARRLTAGVTDERCVTIIRGAATSTGDDVDPHARSCATCREIQDQLVGAIDRVREALPSPPEQLDAKVLDAWAGLLGARHATVNGYPAAPSNVAGRLAAARPAARRAVAAAAAAVLVGGFIAVGAASGPHPVTTRTPALAAAPAATHAVASSHSPSSTTTATPNGGTGVAPIDASATAALTTQLLQSLTSAVTTASVPQGADVPASPANGGTGVQPTNVGTPTAVNPTAPSPRTPTATPATTAAPASTTSTTPTTTVAPKQNPIQPVIDALNKLAHP